MEEYSNPLTFRQLAATTSEMLQHKLSLIEDRRSKSEPLPKGSAPFTSSAHFKLPISRTKPKAKNPEHRFSVECRSQRASTLKAAATALVRTDMITLGTARPSPEYFPWASLTMQSDDSTTSCQNGEEAYDLSVAMNYGYAAGSPQLLRYVTEHVELIHDPPYADWETCLTCGTSSALDILLRIFCDRGDWVLTEQYTYSGAKDAIEGHGLRIMGVQMDDLGLMPEELDQVLTNWDGGMGKKPFLLYTIPTGHNPTGATQSFERRKAIYKVAEKHDLYIVEDDPYYYLQLGNSPTTEEGQFTSSDANSDDYLARLPPSYLSIDTSGRVVRLDSTAKFLAPGLRLGWLTASPQTVKRFLAYTELGAVAPSGPSQVIVFKLLEESWGHRGLIHWLIHLCEHYSRRRDTLIAACQRHLPRNVCQWNMPSAGMFLWIRLNCSGYAHAQAAMASEGRDLKSVAVIEDEVYTKAKELGVLVSKGSWFEANPGRMEDICFRLTFAAAAHKDLEVAVDRFAKAIDAEFTLGSSALTAKVSQ